MAVRWTEEQFQQHIAQRQAAGAVDLSLRAELARLGVAKAVEAEERAQAPEVEGVKKKRRGVNERPIIRALRESVVKVTASESFFAVRLEGARLLTVNEMFSILQYRKNAMFDYKKVSYRKIQDAVALAKLQGSVPALKGPVRVWLYRRGTKRVDRVDMTTIFKYLIDAIVSEGIVVDDSDEVICDIRMQQENGEPAIALRFEEMPEGYPRLGLDFAEGFWEAEQSFVAIEPPQGRTTPKRRKPKVAQSVPHAAKPGNEPVSSTARPTNKAAKPTKKAPSSSASARKPKAKSKA